ncbi:GDP-mannose 4,6-dehydratase [Candidatus Roizmanbacteria bacterium RIFCSPLOWO2_12_FULL_40_12]|uniref:GDP-mannose 4,6-dehydratase n=1 Tax=Candidatus Roizmanbacteria bacterium RIFCSPLOWO2_01_FULL_40_42 TaxID=1802066 RepID=A0A1F7J5B8_9BACT|nr:MAG: GDP-mannose 4,6-dehydratase [Candidatus Roizmanbacteria bacterium RIFCSPHIGHO2_01_FULL_40_98]OGK28244.1 MAG: GDP-mannose 4,6-dehydratase [Candidatus Roizmanbacteria bacterium RIFCSPHIGHO2_02_FULL_40_53]OGK30480.1 MAG: GDP-mannose 4,6-dehydratase [Candidatus Roizmanbacteria bacterium RIFCSPHIGHO2_12_41_18]OGK36894.1 MAG: GDP-mannose 4,6-dehydratase [Candidatus Roizmanbacteria bacterium RIFCSPHIGHO2_12_FULL_40_130]OGK50800.1 MAG: GDP-mannose 4,6-dehydratase [Candidatus Roizmanbacteria bac
MANALITGILGQDGPYLAKLLLEKNYKVYGMIRRYSTPQFDNLDYLGITNKIEYIEGDLTDDASLLNIIKNVRPQEVYNLAAQSFVGSSWEQAKLTTEINAVGVLNLLSAIKLFSPTSKFYQASTSEMFGLGNDNGYQDENTPFHPRSPYGISKVYAHWMTVNFRESYGMFACSGILFNHESPIRGIQFVTRKISDGVAKIKVGLAKDLLLGDLEPKRDWGFAGDYVEAMYKMLQQEKPEDFVVATGETHTVKEFVELAFKTAGIDNWQSYVKSDPRFKRPAEVPHLQGKSDKAQKALGWKPKTPFPDLVKMMVEADIKRYQDKNK